MTRPHVPQAVLDAAHARKAAREGRDWPEADRLKGVIEGLGWRVVDRGADFALSPAVAADVRDGDRLRYGASQSVPSRMGEPDAGPATVIVRATDDGAAVERAVGGLRAFSPAGTQLVVVADGPDPATAETLVRLEADPGAGVELVWMAARLGPGAAFNAGLRRATGALVVLLDASLEPTGDIVSPLAQRLADPSVAVAGAGGLAGTDVRDLREAGPGDVVALDGTLLAMRRQDALARGPLDEQFATARHLATAWSLVLRDGGEDHRPRRAVAEAGLPVRPAHGPAIHRTEVDSDRSVRRDRYRLLDGFGGRRDLMGEGSGT
jgi:hypothetical protein